MKSGVYLILCVSNGAKYVGSSKNVRSRWGQHKTSLRSGRHSCRYLQHCWNKYGDGCFEFSVLEHCEETALLAREQHYVDTLKPELNVMKIVERWTTTPEIKARIAESVRARAARITHCPHGHEYTKENKAVGKKGEPLCRECARIRTRAALAAETPEEKADRLRKNREYHQRHREHRLIMQRNYVARTKDKKRAYDIAYRPIKNARRRRKAA